jgi:putative salt-induced outer membrane protein YdiY
VRFVTFILALAVPSLALAQPGAPTELEKEAPKEDKTSWDIVAGGTAVSGNTKSFGLTAGTQFTMIRGKHRFDAGSMLIYTRARVQSGDIEITARNMNTAARYEYFFKKRDAAFIGAKHRWDTFAGLDTRLQIQPGYLRVFSENEELERRFWGEVGYDFSYDNLHPNPLLDPLTMEVVNDSVYVHAARVFLGWDFKLEDKLRILSGIEALLNVVEPGDLRVNWNTRITTSIRKRVELGVQYLLMYDRIPVPGAKRLDTYFLGNLIVHVI